MTFFCEEALYLLHKSHLLMAFSCKNRSRKMGLIVINLPGDWGSQSLSLSLCFWSASYHRLKDTKSLEDLLDFLFLLLLFSLILFVSFTHTFTLK